MVASRTLPNERNPLVAPENSPSIDDLVNRRRLGQTKLNMKPPKEAEKLDVFDYAHLRVPLPKDLSGSGIFALKSHNTYPESYFLMRRSSDGYISATGMFKAAFPWASLEEEDSERKYQKSLSSAGPEEVAGSVWIAPEEALALADQYGMRMWVDALLDPAPIEKGNKDKHTTNIAMPPRFDTSSVASSISDKVPTLRATRARSTRSASPSKMATPRKIATPRKPRATRAQKAAEIVQTEEMEVVESASSTGALQSIVEDKAVTEVVASEPLQAKDADVTNIEVKETIETNGDIEIKTTNVKIGVPADHPELQEPEDPTEMIRKATAMVEQARELDGGESSKAAQSKRKAEDLGEEIESRPQRPAKLARTISTIEQKHAKEKVTRRALVGAAVMAAITTAITYFGSIPA